MEFVNIKVFSNNDRLSQKSFPQQLQYRPQIGEWMEASDGTIGRICSITHLSNYLKIELTTII